MRIAIIGAGRVGTALATGWRRAGHEVVLGVRDPAQHRDDGHTSIPDAVAGEAEVVVLATPFPAARRIAQDNAAGLDGRVLVDATNDVDFRDGPRVVSPTSAAERIAEAAPRARVVKAFNTVGAEHMSPPPSHYPTVMPVAGDDADARARVLDLAADLNLEPLDAGPLANALALEHLAALWMWAATRGGRGRGISFALIDRNPGPGQDSA